MMEIYLEITYSWKMSVNSRFKGCVRYIFTSLFCMPKREDLWNKEKCFFISLGKLFSFLR